MLGAVIINAMIVYTMMIGSSVMGEELHLLRGFVNLCVENDANWHGTVLCRCQSLSQGDWWQKRWETLRSSDKKILHRVLWQKGKGRDLAKKKSQTCNHRVQCLSWQSYVSPDFTLVNRSTYIDDTDVANCEDVHSELMWVYWLTVRLFAVLCQYAFSYVLLCVFW